MRKLWHLIKRLYRKEPSKHWRGLLVITHYAGVVKKAYLQCALLYFASSGSYKKRLMGLFRPVIYQSKMKNLPCSAISEISQTQLLPLAIQPVPRKALLVMPPKNDGHLLVTESLIRTPTRPVVFSKHRRLMPITRSQFLKLFTTPVGQQKGKNIEMLPFRMASVLMKMRLTQSHCYQDIMKVVSGGPRKFEIDLDKLQVQREAEYFHKTNQKQLQDIKQKKLKENAGKSVLERKGDTPQKDCTK